MLPSTCNRSRPLISNRVAKDAAADPEQLAHTIAMQLLDSRPRTRRELAMAMARRRVPEDAAATVLDRLTAVGLIDDEAFATAWVDSRHTGRGLGRRALRAELTRKGVDAETTAAALESVSDDDELAAARILVERKLRSMSALDRATKFRRLSGLLARKGISGSAARTAIGEALDGSLLAE